MPHIIDVLASEGFAWGVIAGFAICLVFDYLE